MPCRPLRTRSVLVSSIRTISDRGSQIPEPLILLTSECPLEVQISQGLGPFSQVELNKNWPYKHRRPEDGSLLRSTSSKTCFGRAICAGDVEALDFKGHLPAYQYSRMPTDVELDAEGKYFFTESAEGVECSHFLMQDACI